MEETAIAASNLLRTTLEQYTSACSSLQVPSFSRTQESWSGSVHSQLLDRLEDDIKLLETHKRTLFQATVKLKQLRNANLPLVHALPDEVLTTIFQSAIGRRPCIQEEDIPGFPPCPVLLSRVCSHWRRVAISSRMLWSHIDLYLGELNYQSLLARAMLFANRAGDTPLQIHLTRLDYKVKLKHVLPMLKQFLALVATRIYSLDLVAVGGSGQDYVAFDAYILSLFFASCRAGVLSRLTIKNVHDEAHFIWPVGSYQGIHPGLEMALPYARLEHIWGPITSVRLVRSFPYWSSRLYHNLTELCLDSRGESTTPISESQLVNILRASPKLRVLDLDLDITDILPEGALVTAIHLDELEVLKLASPDFESVFRWLSPGPLPLQLSLSNRGLGGSFNVDHDIGEFRTRSNITYLHLLGHVTTYQKVVDIFPQMPGLQTLVLSLGYCLHDDTLQNVTRPYHNGFSTPTIYMIRYCAVIGGLQWITEQDLAPNLVFWNCKFGHDKYPTKEAKLISQSTVSLEFGSNQGLKFLAASEPNPIHDDY